MPDGTRNEMLPDGTQRQTNVDGSVLCLFKSGTKTQQTGTKKITFMPIGITIEEDSESGYKATKFPDGYQLIETADGTTVDLAPDGTTSVTYKDGMSIETFDDGTKKIKLPNGKYRMIPASQAKPKEWQ